MILHKSSYYGMYIVYAMVAPHRRVRIRVVHVTDVSQVPNEILGASECRLVALHL